MKFYTVGHSTLDLDAFIDLLKSYAVDFLADIRRFPASRRYPHFNGEALRDSLLEYGISYRHYEPLGGRRSKSTEASRNRAWSVPSFQYYADYMETPAFAKAIERLLSDAEGRQAAIMCAEAVYFRCHRRLVSDYLLAQGHEIIHIETPSRSRPHTLTDFAVVDRRGLSYPPAESVSRAV